MTRIVLAWTLILTSCGGPGMRPALAQRIDTIRGFPPCDRLRNWVEDRAEDRYSCINGVATEVMLEHAEAR